MPSPLALVQGPVAQPIPMQPPTMQVVGVGFREDEDDQDGINRDKDIVVPNADDVPNVDGVWVYEVTLALTFASSLGQQLKDADIVSFERTVSEKCVEFYASYRNGSAVEMNDAKKPGHRDRRHRHLETQQRRRNARDVLKADVVFVRQKMSFNDNDQPETVITYDQHFVFNPNANGPPEVDNIDQNDDDDDDDGDMLLYTPMELSKLPFNVTEWNMQLGNELKENIPALKDVKLPFEVPHVPDQAQFQLTDDKSKNDNGKLKELSEGGVAGIFLAVAFVFMGVGIYLLRSMEFDLAVKPKPKPKPK